MRIKKWNDEKNDYDFVKVPDEWKLPLYSEDMDEIINCVNCGREVKFGECYTSMRYHSGAGFGYNECPECYEEYLPQRLQRARDKGELKESDKLKERMSKNPKLTLLVQELVQRLGGLTETHCQLINELLDELESNND